MVQPSSDCEIGKNANLARLHGRYLVPVAVTSDRRERKKQRTREAIQDAALELFAKDGYRATTIGAIADAADVAPRTVTMHFPAKEDLLFAYEPFTPQSLAARLDARAPGEDALAAVRGWMAATLSELEAGPADRTRRMWMRRALRSRLVMGDEHLRARARSGYYDFEVPLAAAIARDMGQPSDALAARLAATTVVTGLRELYESGEARGREDRGAADELLVLVDRVLDFVRAGLAALG